MASWPVLNPPKGAKCAGWRGIGRSAAWQISAGARWAARTRSGSGPGPVWAAAYATEIFADFAIGLIATKPVKPCDEGIFRTLNLLSKTEQDVCQIEAAPDLCMSVRRWLLNRFRGPSVVCISRPVTISLFRSSRPDHEQALAGWLRTVLRI